jgi:hypothetical protein
VSSQIQVEDRESRKEKSAKVPGLVSTLLQREDWVKSRGSSTPSSPVRLHGNSRSRAERMTSFTKQLLLCSRTKLKVQRQHGKKGMCTHNWKEKMN